MIVAAVALIDAEGRVLLQRRRADRGHGGLWEFPGGKLEPGEGPEAAAMREMAEELGVAIAPAALDPVGFASGARADGGGIVILLYACRTWRGEPRCLDAEAIGWFEPAAVPGLAMPPLDYPLAAALNRLLGD
jgi:8-oxo-dGTP diphosphatase